MSLGTFINAVKLSSQKIFNLKANGCSKEIVVEALNNHRVLRLEMTNNALELCQHIKQLDLLERLEKAIADENPTMTKNSHIRRKAIDDLVMMVVMCLEKLKTTPKISAILEKLKDIDDDISKKVVIDIIDTYTFKELQIEKIVYYKDIIKLYTEKTEGISIYDVIHSMLLSSSIDTLDIVENALLQDGDRECEHILLNGRRKGERCGCRCDLYRNYCTNHISYNMSQLSRSILFYDN